MEKLRPILDAVFIAVALVVIPGLTMGLRSIFANQHFAHGHVLLGWLELSGWINRLGLPVAMVVHVDVKATSPTLQIQNCWLGHKGIGKRRIGHG